MSTTFAAPARKKTPVTTPARRPERPRRSYTQQRRAARRAAADRSLRARLVKGRSLVDLAVGVREGGSRWPFAIVFALIAGVSVVALLILNTATAQTSFTERQLSQELAELTLAEQQLQQQVAAKQAPSALAQKAVELGMQPGANPGNLVINADGTVTWVEPKPRLVPPPAPAADPENPAAQQTPADDAAQQAPADDAAQQPPADQPAPAPEQPAPQDAVPAPTTAQPETTGE
ncbi:hypothetical protein [Blastococcus sp. Marseille-P5729]|uniref:hypothetical protein n=1 Tax=Blastococcus sp. Marseille-P5729 TaxID=2086582 RepID=UPI000D0F59CD|nr:hypothetical protein [Blastococcus sp. Marseille-P5729]